MLVEIAVRSWDARSACEALSAAGIGQNGRCALSTFVQALSPLYQLFSVYLNFSNFFSIDSKVKLRALSAKGDTINFHYSKVLVEANRPNYGKMIFDSEEEFSFSGSEPKLQFILCEGENAASKTDFVKLKNFARCLYTTVVISLKNGGKITVIFNPKNFGVIGALFNCH